MSDFDYDDELPDGIFYEDDEDDDEDDDDIDWDDFDFDEDEDEDADIDDDSPDNNKQDSRSDNQADSAESEKGKEPSKSEGGRYGDTSSPSNGGKTGQTGKPTTQTAPKAGGSNIASSGGKAVGSAGKSAGGKLAGGAGKAMGGGGGGIGGIFKALGAIPWQAWLVIGIIVTVIIILVIIVAIISYFENKTDPLMMSANEYVTSEFFYGTRSVFIDEPALINSLQLSYKQYVVDLITNIDENNDITINIIIPDEFDNTTEIDAHITNMSLAIANIVATNSSEYVDIDITALYPQIEYFGLTTAQGSSANDFITKYFKDHNIITPASGEMSEIDLMVDNAMAHENLQYIYNLCEKFMIKDEIASEKGLEDIQTRLYVASVYMPNKDILIESAYYTISSFDDVFHAVSQLINEENGNQNILKEKETKDNRDVITGFTSGQIRVKQFTSIDSENPTAFNSEMSIFQALRLSPEYKNYFTLNTETGAYTWKPTCESLYYLTFESETKFIFTDFDLNVKLP